MSAFLGPIHHIMYERIQLVAARTKDLEGFVRERMSPGQVEELDAKLDAFRHVPPEGDLEMLIGEMPIHAWLQEQMERTMLCEARLWHALADREERKSKASLRLREHGMRVGEAMLTEEPRIAQDARLLLQGLDRILLQSMPCDRVSEVVAASEKSFIERRDLLFHQPIWNRSELSVETALELQEAWMQGLFGVIPGVRFTRAEITVGGQRLFDDRVTLPRKEDQDG